MGIKIVSDFEDYYDKAQDPGGREWWRMDKPNLSRFDALALLNRCQVRTPRFGLARDLIRVLDPTSQVIEYTDIFDHHGLGKHLAPIGAVNQVNPKAPCMEYIFQSRGASIIYIKVGMSSFWFLESNPKDGEWRSNHGGPEPVRYPIAAVQGDLQARTNFFLDLAFPIFKIDHVMTDGFILATDLNLSPHLGPYLHNCYSPEQMMSQISDWFDWMDEVQGDSNTNFDLPELRKESDNSIIDFQSIQRRLKP